ncbi:MAG TPA: head GIN domain-containing protein [Hanamia sp.]
MKSFLILLFSVFGIHSFGQTIINDPNAEVRNTGSFSAIKASDGIDIYLSQGDDYALAVSASDKKYIDYIKTEIKNGVLIISYDGRTFKYNNNRRLRAYISFKDLESLEASAASNYIISGTLITNSLRIKLSGASEIKGTIDIQNLQMDLRGASLVKVNGTVQNLKIEAGGASDVKNYDLVVDNCVANLGGASDVKITVNKSLIAKAGGASTLYYKGNPEKKDVSSEGASTISQKD